MSDSNHAELQARVVGMYERHPFPSIEDRVRKTESEMRMRLMMLGVRPEDYAGKRVLDGGCGTGEYSCWYARQGANVTAVDLSEPSLAVGREYAQREGIDNVRFQKQSVLNLEFPNDSFDYVYSMGVLHHTPDPYRGFRELCRVLRPGGVLVVSLYNRFGRLRHNLKQALIRRLAGDDVDRRVELAKKIFPGTCRALKQNRHDASDIIIYDAFGIPHESQHTAGEVLKWFDKNGISYVGSFGPLTVSDNLKALKIMNDPKHEEFRRFFDGHRMAAGAVRALPAMVGRLLPEVDSDRLAFRRPSVLSRGLVQGVWFLLGFRFSIFAMSGRKADQEA
jgi:2-polyprenyl-3-methyl-5-hydroxy-6-metoxy-1,4-benzoquinol methylase